MNLKELVGQWFGFSAQIDSLKEDYNLMEENRDYWHSKYETTVSELTATTLKLCKPKETKTTKAKGRT